LRKLQHSGASKSEKESASTQSGSLPFPVSLRPVNRASISGAQDNSTDGSKNSNNNNNVGSNNNSAKASDQATQASSVSAAKHATALPEVVSHGGKASEKAAKSAGGKMGEAEEGFIIDSISAIDSSLQSLEGTWF
jgi:hypothetical protein